MKIFFIVMTLVGVLLPILAPLNNRHAGRRLFWSGFFIATASAFFIAYPPDWKSGIGLSILVDSLMLINAYFSTPYIKIRGKIYAFSLRDSSSDPSPEGEPPAEPDDPARDPAPDSYSGLATAKKMWWLLIFVMAICVINVISISEDRPWLTPLAAAVGVAIAIVFGYGDASWRYPIARGELVQFVIIAIITVGVFAILYLTAYYAGKRWPLRRKQSMEYRAHPRHQKKYP